MDKRTLGFAIAILAVLGGIYAIQNLFLQPQTVEDNSEIMGAGNFASAFLDAYFIYSQGEGFAPIVQFTNLKDQRRAQDTILSQKASSKLLSVQQLKSEYSKAQILLTVKTKYLTGEENRQREETKENYYVATVWVVQDAKGYRVIHYPALREFTKSEADPPYPSAASAELADSMKSMLVSFFRTYFVADKTGDVSNFFSAATEPVLLNTNLEFVSLDQIEVYGEQMPWLVYANVRARDPDTGLEFNLSFEMFVRYENGKYAIETINF